MKNSKRALAAAAVIILIIISLTHCASQPGAAGTADTITCPASTGSAPATKTGPESGTETGAVTKDGSPAETAPETESAPGTDTTDAAPETLTAEEEETLKNAVWFVLKMDNYEAGALSNDDDLARAAARMFPDKVLFYNIDGISYSPQGDLENDSFKVDLTEDELLEFARSQWPYMSDGSLREQFLPLIGEDGIWWGNCGGHGFYRSSESGTYAGYAAENGVFSLYYTNRIYYKSISDAFQFGDEEEIAAYEEAVAAHNGGDFFFDGYDLTADENGDYYLKDFSTRVFRFRLTDDGRADFISCEWGIDIPADDLIRR